MKPFTSIHSQHEDAHAVIEDCVAQISDLESAYNFGFLYATDSMAAEYDMLADRCKQATGIDHWVGTLGIGIVSDDKEYYDTPAASILLANFDEADFSILPNLTKLDDVDQLSSDYEVNVGILHGDPYCEDAQAIIQQLASKLQHGFMLGGLTSSRDSHLQLADSINTSGVSGVVFSEKVAIASNLSQGCSPVGDKHTISKADQNVLHSLDGEPSLDVVMRDCGAENVDDLRELASDIFVGLCIPGSDRSDYTVRNIVGMDVRHRILAVNDYLTEDNELIFCKRDQESAFEDLRNMLQNLASRLDGPPRGGLYVSCLGRGREQFGDNSEEVALIREVLGDFPVTGFFANGEIHHDKLYGYTGVLTLFL